MKKVISILFLLLTTSGAIAEGGPMAPQCGYYCTYNGAKTYCCLR